MKRKMLFIVAIMLLGSTSCYDSNFAEPETTGTVTDADGNTYNTIKIGSQWWIKENLKTTKYADGSPIINGAWAYSDAGYNTKNYGLLYSFYTVANKRGLCPTGWHVPTDNDWSLWTSVLKNGYNKAAPASVAKETGTAHWKDPNFSTNETGFTALAGGWGNSDGIYKGMTEEARWWSSRSFDPPNEVALYWKIEWDSDNIIYDPAPKTDRYSVRCVMDK